MEVSCSDRDRLCSGMRRRRGKKKESETRAMAKRARLTSGRSGRAVRMACEILCGMYGVHGLSHWDVMGAQPRVTKSLAEYALGMWREIL